MKKRYYIAYGSNLNIWQMKMRCKTAKIIGTSVIENYMLMFKGSKTGFYLTIEPKENEKVPVGIWEVTADDEIALDRYEGFPDFYYKKDMVLPVKNMKSGKISNLKAFVYIMHEDRQLGIPTERYFKTCADGYKDFNFPLETLFHALDYSKGGILDEGTGD